MRSKLAPLVIPLYGVLSYALGFLLGSVLK
jgi:hypothetical protein